VRIKPQGRIAVFEIMFGTEPQSDMKSLKEKALELVKQGITTSEEAERVISFD
jgi:type II secretory ATPase GspE/PulE/Tfp pilus assembly ATPase PilB-like protein